MRYFIFISLLIFRTIIFAFKCGIYVLRFVFNLIDGGEECDDDFDHHPSNYNFRTGELDSVERADGIYDNLR